MKFSLFPYSSEHKAQLIKLLAFKWKGKNRKQIEQQFTWRYESNPFDTTAAIFLASHENEITGFRGVIVQTLILNSEQYKGFMPADAIVHPSFRRMSVFSQLNTTIISRIHDRYSGKAFVLNLTSNKMSRSGNLKQGWQRAKTCKKTYYRVSRYNYLRYLITKNKIPSNTSDLIAEQENMRFEFSNTIRARELALFWEKHRPENKITALRNEDYYSWRYLAPGSDYVFLYATIQGKLEGYLILRKGRWSKYTLEEYHATSLEILKKMLVLAQKKLAVTVLKTETMSNDQRIILRDAGFEQRSGVLSVLWKPKQIPILVRPMLVEPGEKDFFIQNMDIRDMENWLLFQADAY